MRIVLVSNTTWSIVNFRINLIKHLIKQKHEVHIVGPTDGYEAEITNLGLPFHSIMLDRKGVNPLKNLAIINALEKIYKSVKPDLIIHYTIKPNIYGSIAANRAKIPSLAIVTGLGFVFINDGMVSKIAKYLYKRAFRHPREVWFLNQEDKQIFIEGNLVNANKTKILPGEGVDMTKFVPKDYSQSNETFIFLYVGRVLIDKGLREYIASAKSILSKHAHVKFQILGNHDKDYPLSLPEDEFTKAKEDNIVEYLGYTNDVPGVMCNADCIVLPSYREGVPLVLLEACSMEIPIVATNVTGCNEVIVDNVNGYICEAKDDQSLTQALTKMHDTSKERRMEMGKAGRTLVEEKFNEEIVFEQFDQFIASINL